MNKADTEYRKDIICMAREASPKNHDRNIFFDMMVEDLERFAELVRKDYSTTHANLWLDRINKFVLEEREACIKIVEDEAMQYAEPVWAFEIVNDIKARGQA